MDQDMLLLIKKTVINGLHCWIRHMTIKSFGKTVYNIDNLKIVANVKNLLEYFDDFTRSVTENSLWYLDTDGTTANINAGSKLDDY